MNPPNSQYIQQSRRLCRKGNYTEAIAVLETALSARPADPDILFELALVASQAGMDELAIKMYQVLLQLKPDALEAHNNLANCLFREGRPSEARDVVLTALQHDQSQAELWISLGNAQILTQEFSAASAAFHKALQLQPGASEAFAGIADLLLALLRFDEAIPFFDRAIQKARKPASRQQLRFNRSLALLMAGRLPEAWDEYEVRWGSHLRKVKYRPQHKLLKKHEIAGHTVLILPEQGLGDEIEMASIYKDLIARGAELQIATDPRLVPIFRRSFPSAEVIDFELTHEAGLRHVKIDKMALNKQTHFAIPATSLPQLFRRQISDFSGQGAYLTADPSMAAEWRQRLAKRFGDQKPIVGFCWRSGKRTGQRKLHYRDLSVYRTILESSECVFVNLQYDIDDSELQRLSAEVGVSIENFPDLDQWQDLEGVFALISELDLVISDTTMVATVAGALSVPTLRRGLGPFHCGHNPSPFQPSVMGYQGVGQIELMRAAQGEFMEHWRAAPDRTALRGQYASRAPQKAEDRGRQISDLILPD